MHRSNVFGVRCVEAFAFEVGYVKTLALLYIGELVVGLPTWARLGVIFKNVACSACLRAWCLVGLVGFYTRL